MSTCELVRVQPPAWLAGEVGVISSGTIIGTSRPLRHVMEQVDAVASTDATVLITGESGTGKELLAKEVHGRSPLFRRPFVKVNCSAIPREIFESEFFGHARGAFTGAVRERQGRFQIADGGRFSSTKSATCRSSYSRSCCECYRRESPNEWARTAPGRSMSE